MIARGGRRARNTSEQVAELRAELAAAVPRAAVPPDVAAIAAAVGPLADLPRWCGWRYVVRDDRPKPAKPPQRTDGEGASVERPDDWRPLAEVAAVYESGRYPWAGVGLLLVADDDLAAVDLDGCVEAGAVAPWALEVVARLGSYAELSPSGTGVRVLVRGRTPWAGRKVGVVESYQSARYMTVTGVAIPGQPGLGEIRESQAGLDWFVAEHLDDEDDGDEADEADGASAPAAFPPSPPTAPAGGRSFGFRGPDAELLRLALERSPTLRAVAAGDLSRWPKRDGSPDRSVADAAVVQTLYWWTGPDPARLLAVAGEFLRRHAPRPKLDRPDYLPNTVARLLRSPRGGYLGDGSAGGSAVGLPAAVERAPTGTHGGVFPPAVRGPVTAAELMARRFEPRRWAVPGVLPGGLTLLAGRPKVGKSWAALQTAIAVASGGELFGAFQAESGDVLVLSLEDGPARTQERLRRLLGDEPVPDRLTFAFECPPAGPEFDAMVRGWLAGKSSPLLVVDTLSRLRLAEKASADVFRADYRAVESIRALLPADGAALVVAHRGKRQSDDYFETLAGSNALAAAADGVCVVERERGRREARYKLSHRDGADVDIGLEQPGGGVAWVYVPDGSGPRSGQRAAAAALLSGGPVTAAELAGRLGLSAEAGRQLLSRMARDGQAVRVGCGRYGPPGRAGESPPSVTQDRECDTEV